ncbi:hypothetical protein [Lacipirellula parvula]|nr:hypothetical protein [Lacipirellula parvula]
MPDSATFEGTTVAKQELAECGDFGLVRNNLLFPLWYPALVFALAAVAAIRVGRQFTLRSALVGMSVAAALLGMAVAL